MDPASATPTAWDGIVFDFDGVLFDGMALHAEAYRRTLAPFGVNVSDGDVYEREGARSETILRDLLERSGRAPTPSDVDALAEAKQKLFASLGPGSLYPGARAIVQAARERFPYTGLVTGTRRANLERFAADLLPLLDVVLAQADYENDKPHPEPYAKAADRLGQAPARLVAVENAPRGVQSAKAAGYGRVVAICTTMDAGALEAAGSDLVVDDHEGLAAWVRSNPVRTPIGRV